MRQILLYEFEADEIGPRMSVVGETFMRGSNPTKTGRGLRLKRTMFDEEEQDDINRMVDRCKRVYRQGLKDVVRLTSYENNLLDRLVQYCMSL